VRIHTSATSADLWQAATKAGVDYELTTHTSRTHARAFEVKLTGASRRRPNTNSRTDPDAFAATWDQWGVFLGAIFDADPDARMGGTAKRPAYANRPDFDYKTLGRFEDGWPDDAHGDHTFRFAGIPFTQACTKCSAVVRWGI
jgi:hypothetical protein